MAKKVRRTRKKTTRKKAAAEDALSVDLDDEVEDPEIVVHEPEIDLGAPQEVPADHLVDDQGVPIALGPSHVRDKDAEPTPAATAPAVLGSQIGPIARRQRLRLWLWLGAAVAVVVGVVVVLCALPREEGPETMTATVEGHILLRVTDDRLIELSERDRAVIPVGTEIEAGGIEVSALHLDGGWVLWLKPKTRLKVISLVPDVKVDLLEGALGGHGSTEAMLIVNYGGDRPVRGQPRSRFSIERTGQEAKLIVVSGVVKGYDPSGKPRDFKANMQMAWGKKASIKPTDVNAKAITGWMSVFPRVSWVTAHRDAFEAYKPAGYEGDVSHFESKVDTSGRMMLVNTTVPGSHKLIMVEWKPTGNLRLTTRFNLQKATGRKAAVGLLFGYGRNGEHYAVRYVPEPQPKIQVTHHGQTAQDAPPLPLTETLPRLSWHTLTVEVVGKQASVTLNDRMLGKVEVDQYAGGQTGLLVENALAQWQLFLLKDPTRRKADGAGR